MAKTIIRLLDIGCNLQLVSFVILMYPDFLIQDVLIPITILNILTCLCVHYILVYGLMVIDSAILPIIYEYLSVEHCGDTIIKLFLLGLVVHLAVLHNKLITNMI